MESERERVPYIQSCVNGRMKDAREPALSPLDRSFLYGDAAYEVWRTYSGRLLAWGEHWERLTKTASAIYLQLPFDSKTARAEVERTMAAWRQVVGDHQTQLYARLQISRGSGPIGLDVALADRPNFVIYVKALPEMSSREIDPGVAVHIAKKWRRNSIESLPPALKTGNYLNNILGLREAKQAGASEVVFLNATGHVTEASTKNVWFVVGDAIVTPPLTAGILSGITRKLLLEQVREFESLPLIERSLRIDDLRYASECFLSSTTQDIQPVCRVDDLHYQIGPRTLTRRLKSEFVKLAVKRSIAES